MSYTYRVMAQDLDDAFRASGKGYSYTFRARSKTEEVIPAGQEVRVLHIQGVKVIVEPVTADQTKAV